MIEKILGHESSLAASAAEQASRSSTQARGGGKSADFEPPSINSKELSQPKELLTDQVHISRTSVDKSLSHQEEPSGSASSNGANGSPIAAKDTGPLAQGDDVPRVRKDSEPSEPSQEATSDPGRQTRSVAAEESDREQAIAQQRVQEQAAAADAEAPQEPAARPSEASLVDAAKEPPTIDTDANRVRLSTGITPEQILQNAERVFKAATAARPPSTRDLSIASEARRVITQTENRAEAPKAEESKSEDPNATAAERAKARAAANSEETDAQKAKREAESQDPKQGETNTDEQNFDRAKQAYESAARMDTESAATAAAEAFF